MSTALRMTRDEKEAAAIGKALVKALARLERCTCDPTLILDEAQMCARHERAGVRAAISALTVYYTGCESSSDIPEAVQS